MKCHHCNGRGGVGHYSTEPTYRGRPTMVEGSERSFACDTCNGTGQVSEAVYSQSVLAEDERQRAFDNDMADLQYKFEQELRRERNERYFN